MPRSTPKEVRQIKVHGKWYWQARPSYKGRRKSRLCETEREAKQAKAQLLMELMDEVEEEARTAAQPASLEIACDMYMADLRRRGKGQDTIYGVLVTKRRLQSFFGTRMNDPIGSLTDADLFAYRAARERSGNKPSSINRDLANLQVILKLALGDYRFPKGLFFPRDNTRVRFMTDEQEARVLGLLRSPFREIAQVALNTLMRLSEILQLRREQVFLDRAIIVLQKSKTGPREVILNTEAQRILGAQLAAHDGPWVFPSPRTGGPCNRGYVGYIWRKAAREAGLEDFHFHDLRHHGATIAINAGYSTEILMALGGWKTAEMMRRYAKVLNPTLRAAAEAICGNTKRQQAA